MDKTGWVDRWRMRYGRMVRYKAWSWDFYWLRLRPIKPKRVLQIIPPQMNNYFSGFVGHKRGRHWDRKRN